MMGVVKKSRENTDAPRILIIDEGAQKDTPLEEILEASGLATKRCKDSGDGLRYIRRWKPSIILLDQKGPLSKARAVCEEIRSIDLEVRPSIIVITDRRDKEEIHELIADGADDVIFRPVEEVELNARIWEQLKLGDFFRNYEAEKKGLESLLEISTALSATLNPRDILRIIVERVAEATGAERCSIVLVSDGDEGYVLASHDDPELKDLPIDLSRYPEIKEAVRTKSPFFADEMTSHPVMQGVKQYIKQLQGKSVLIVPIVFNDRVLGTIFLRTKKKAHGFNKDEIDFCRIVANTSYHAIKNARIYQKLTEEKEYLREAAIRDHLTSLYNHNHFYLRLEEDFERARRYGIPLAIIMIDLDNFKKVNDTYGHRTGDVVLKETARAIRGAIRRSDLVARYGGEEFAVILPHTDLRGASGEAERIRKVIEGHNYSGLPDVRITASLGVAAFPHEKITEPGDLVTLADDALYRAKHSGRNRVVVYNGESFLKDKKVPED